MPVPAHALFWASIGYTFQTSVPQGSIGFIGIMIVGVVLLSWLLVSEFPMFSLKVKSLRWKGNELRYILVGGAILFVALFGVLGIAGTIVLYIALSFFNRGK
jgi:CDP-diacylglycerol--serine O-phosphatidyltransferase